MRLIDADKLKNAILIRCDDLDDLNLLDDMRGLQQALDLLDQMQPVCAVTLEEVLNVFEKAKAEIIGKNIEGFADQLMWQIKHEYQK